MSRRLTAKFAILVLGMLTCATAQVQAQEHVRLVPQLGAGYVTSIAASPDGRFVLTGGDATRLWDAATARQLQTFPGNASSVAFSPDSRLILTGGGDTLGLSENSVRLWDISTGKQLRTFSGPTSAVTFVAFSPDASQIFAGSRDGAARVWDAATGKQIGALDESSVNHSPGTPQDTVPLEYQIPAENTHVAFSPDGRLVLTGLEAIVGGGNDPVKLWNGNTGHLLQTLPTPKAFSVTSVAFSPDGRIAFAAGADISSKYLPVSIHVWDVSTGNPLRSFLTNTSLVAALAISPDGGSILVAGSDSKEDPNAGLLGFSTIPSLRLFNAVTGEQIRAFDGISSAIQSIAFSPDGRSILIGCMDGTTPQRETATGRKLPSFAGHARPIYSAAFSPDGHSLLTAGEDQTARLWDTETGQQSQAFTGHTGPIRSVAFSPDSRTVLTGSGDKSARLWDLATGKQLRAFEGHDQDGVWSVAFSPDGRSVLTGAGSQDFEGNDYATRLWNAATGELDRTLPSPRGESLQSVAFSPDGRLALVGYQYEGDEGVGSAAVLWDLETGKRIPTFAVPTGGVSAVAFSPDGRSILTAATEFRSLNKGKMLQKWDVATGKEIPSFDANIGWGGCLTFSPDGRFALTASAHGAALLDAATGELIRTFDANNITSAVAFSPDGRIVLTASLDTTTRLWDASTGKQLATLLSFENKGWAVTDVEGRYDSNDPDNNPGLVWVTDSLRPIELNQLEDNYYTPNLLARILKGERLPEVRGLDLIPPPPQVVITTPYEPVSKHLVLAIANQGGGIGRIVVSVNGRKAAEIDHPVLTGGKPTVSVDLSDATLQRGANIVKAYAFDAGNQIRSQEAVATFQFGIRTVASGFKGVIPMPGDRPTGYKPKFYAILVGVAKYAEPKLDLVYPAHDAESISTGLEIGAGKLFGPENVHLRLLTSNAKDPAGRPTKQNIAAAFEDVKKDAKSSDVLLIYLSGHGVNLRSEKDSYYYLTTDARSLDIDSNPALRQLSTVSGSELRNWLGAKGMPLKEVLIMDTCAAGAANEELVKLVEKRDVPPDQRRAIEFLKDSTGTIILMGSAADKSSYEATRYSQGLLTYALLQGMKGRSIEDGSRLNVSRWFQNASEDVPQLAQSIGGIQRPVIAMPSGSGFPVALLVPEDQAKIPLAAVKPELIQLRCHDEDDNDPLGLEAAVREQLREISHPSIRGNGTGPNPDPAIVYFDLIDGPADSLTPKIVYRITGSTVSLRLRIEQSGKTVKEDHLTLSTEDKPALAAAIATKLATLASQIPTTPQNP